MMGNEMPITAQPPAALPVVTFTDDVTLHLNGDDVHVIHMAPAHTDGDSIVHFKTANVIHIGDTVTGATRSSTSTAVVSSKGSSPPPIASWRSATTTPRSSPATAR